MVCHPKINVLEAWSHCESVEVEDSLLKCGVWCSVIRSWALRSHTRIDAGLGHGLSFGVNYFSKKKKLL